MREHHSHDRHHELIGSNLSELLNANLDVPHADLSDVVLLVSQALDHDRHQLGEVINEFVEAVSEEEQHAAVCLPDLTIGVFGFRNHLFQIGFEVSDTVG